MAIFKKEGEVIDITALQKRGIIKKAEENKSDSYNSDGYADLTQKTASQTASQFDFLSALANANSASISPSPSSLNTYIKHLYLKL